MKYKHKFLMLSVLAGLSGPSFAALEAWSGQTYAGKGEGEVIFDGSVYKNAWWVGPEQCPGNAAIDSANNGWRVDRPATAAEISTIGNPTDCSIDAGEESGTQQYDEFSADQAYNTGDIVVFAGVTYKTSTDVKANTFAPGQNNPWAKYAPLAEWKAGQTYQKGDEVVGADNQRYMALFYAPNIDPTLTENQNPSQDNGKPWLPKGAWHNYTQQELDQALVLNTATDYPANTLVKYQNEPYLNNSPVKGVQPGDQNPWKVYIDWGNTKELVGTPKTEWPKQFYAPYIDFVMNDVPDMAQLKKEQGINNFVLAFIVAKNADTCMPTWGTSYPVNDYAQYAKIKALRDAGGDVMVSVGGANNSPMAMACKNVDDLVEVYDGIVKNLNLKVLDFDIEGMAVADAESIDRRNLALARLQARWQEEGRDIKLWYTLPIIPEGLTADGMKVLNSAKEHGVRLDGINVMTMDYGRPQCQSSLDETEEQQIHGQCAKAAINTLFTQVKSVFPDKPDEQVWSMLGTTPMIGYNDVQGEVFYTSDAKLVLEHAKENNIGMIGIWSMLRDRPGVAGQVSPEHSGMTEQQADTYAFSRIFNAFSEQGGEIIDQVTANAGVDQVVTGPATVTLDGSGTHLPEGAEPVRYQWTQLAGPDVALSAPNAVSTSFNVLAENAHYEFRLEVTADEKTSQDEVAVNVSAAEIEPVVSISGEQFTVNEGESITINTTANVSEGVTYHWSVTPDNLEFTDNGSSLALNAPQVDQDVTYEVKVDLTDGQGNTATDSARLVVKNVETPVGGEYEYVFPNSIGSYVAGTRVLFGDGHIYECFGDWAANCNNQSFAPTVAADPTWWQQQWKLVK